MRAIVFSAGRWSLAIVVLLGIAGGVFVMRRVLKRVDAMTDTTQTIMRGDLSERLPIAGTGDELRSPRRQSQRHVGAHRRRSCAASRRCPTTSPMILKTPLTRLRNRCEEALRTAEDESQYRAALEDTIEESDGLIRTFNALLMIARVESGQARDDMSEFDAAEVARGIGELYEPLADDKGLALKVEAPAAAPVRGNRELVSQALANLVDNAIKYTVPRPALNGAQSEIIVKAAVGEGDRILLTVSDPGPGIPEADRSPARSSVSCGSSRALAAGLGLGLSLAHAVARLHGGELKPRGQRAGTALGDLAAARRADPANSSSRTTNLPLLIARACRNRSRHASLAAPWILRSGGALLLGARLLQAEEAHARLADWLAGVSGTPAGATLKRLIADHSNVQALMAGLAEGSPISGSWCGRIRTAGDALAIRPESRLDAILAGSARALAATQDEADRDACLRRMKAEASLLDRALRHRRRCGR